MSESPSTIRLRRGAWDGDGEAHLPVPDSWKVTNLRLASTQALTSHQIREAIDHPVAVAPITELADGKRDIAIIVDDLTRPTRADELLGPLVERLAAAGVNRERLTLFIACGSHEAPPMADVACKAGSSLGMFRRVVVHDCHAECIELGKTRRGTPVSVNASLMACVAGPLEPALEMATQLYRPLASVSVPPSRETDAVILDAYPFDGTLQFAHDRALWPVKDLHADVPVVLIARCQRGEQARMSSFRRQTHLQKGL
jgi:nickel-dependent lactate racemase